MKFNFDLIHKNKMKILSLLGVAIMLAVTGCEGQNVGGTQQSATNTHNPVSNQDGALTSKIQPKFESGAWDKLIPNYSSDVVPNNPQQNNNPHLKTIKIINNEAVPMYAMVYQSESQSDTSIHERRIYVNGTSGIPGGCTGNDFNRCTAIVAVPQTMWRGGRVFLSTVDLFADKNFGVSGGSYTIDTIPNSINKGDYVYMSPKAYGVDLNSPSQLVEFTFDIDNTNPDNDYVGYNISYVDHVYLPVAMEDQQGATGGYLGTNMTLSTMDYYLNNYINGKYTSEYFTHDNSGANLGWPFFNMPNPTYPRIPGGYNYFIMANEAPAYDINMKLISNHYSNNSGKQLAYLNTNVDPERLTKKWLEWVIENPTAPSPQLTADEQHVLGKFAKNCGDDNYCKKFADTVTKLWYSGYAGLVAVDPSQKNITATGLIQLIVGYSFPTAFQNLPPVIYTNTDPAVQANSYPEAVKSVLRGVPYRYEDYDVSSWYPSPEATNSDGTKNTMQKYNLDPMVWFIHKKLDMGGYGFSIDDEISFVRERQLSVGNPQSGGVSGLTISIGGLTGIKNKKPYDPFHAEQLITGVSATKLNWTKISDTLGLTNSCAMPGSCNLGFNESGTQSTTITLTANDPKNSTVTFTLVSSKNESGINVLHVKDNSCSVTGDLNQNAICGNGTNGGIFPNPNMPWIVTAPNPIMGSGGGGTGGGTGKFMLYYPTGWSSIVSNDCGVSASNSGGGAVAIKNGKANLCHFELTGSNNVTINFTLGIDNNSGILTQVSNCSVTSDSSKQCNLSSFNINGTPATNLSIATPDGSVTNGSSGGGTGGGKYTLYYPTGWSSIVSSDCGVSVSNSGGGAVSFTNGNASLCHFELTGSNNITIDFALAIDNSNNILTQISNCSVTSDSSKQCNLSSFNINGTPATNLSIATPDGSVTNGSGGGTGGGSSSGTYTLYYPAGWASIVSSDCGVNASNLNGGATSFNTSANTCHFSLVGSSSAISVNFVLNIDTSNKVLTQVSQCQGTKNGSPAQCILPSFAINGTPATNLNIAPPEGSVQ